MMLTGIGGYAVYRSETVNTRLAVSLSARQAEDFAYKKHWEGWQRCPEPAPETGCRMLRPEIPPTLAIIGDSHAGHLASGLAELYGESENNPVIHLQAGCAPFYPVTFEGREYFNCENGHIANALDSVISSPSVRTVVLANFGNFYLHGRLKASVSSESYFVGYTSEFSGKALNSNIEAFRLAVFETLGRLTKTDKRIIFLVDVPELNFNPRECVSQRRLTLVADELRVPCRLEKQISDDRSLVYHTLVAEVGKAFPTVDFIDAGEALCDKQGCDILVDGALLYSSRDHLTTHGSRKLIQRISDQMP